ncbi:hypothetical protein KQI86_15995 [Clostridium sp. MSJ-11]|uniref:Uncharacterized protein n=1 Tax=Clostridium mobile TaxID=2841512 RepID=A0ABS6EKT5_9CLOT|nr:hypothetical protein [Clostridium mobile]MBU5485822.1 hypothetical protein [Clostridium mobile]
MGNKFWGIAVLIFMALAMIFSVFLERSSAGQKISKNKKIKNVLIYTLLALSFGSYLCYSTEFISDFIYASIISIALITISILWEKYSKNYKYKKIIEGVLVWSILFTFFRLLNKNLVISAGHYWIPAMAVLSIRNIFKEDDDKTSGKILLANIIGVVLVVFMFNYFSEPYRGRGKAEIAGEKYLIESGIAKKGENIKIDRLNGNDEYVRMFAKLEDNQVYTLYYKLGKIEKADKLVH